MLKCRLTNNINLRGNPSVDYDYLLFYLKWSRFCYFISLLYWLLIILGGCLSVDYEHLFAYYLYTYFFFSLYIIYSCIIFLIFHQRASRPNILSPSLLSQSPYSTKRCDLIHHHHHRLPGNSQWGSGISSSLPRIPPGSPVWVKLLFSCVQIH